MKARVPETYDEVTRRTVLEPDGSRRPIPGTPTRAADDAALRAQVADVLLFNGYTDVGLEVEHGRITLRGRARDLTTIERVARLAQAAAPDAEIANQMHVEP